MELNRQGDRQLRCVIRQQPCNEVVMKLSCHHNDVPCSKKATLTVYSILYRVLHERINWIKAALIGCTRLISTTCKYNGIATMSSSKVLIVAISAMLLTFSRALSMSTATASVSATSKLSMKPVQKKSAVIIGAGPVGLAASLMLEKCGWTDITVVEKRSRDSFESTKAYLYLVDRRGHRLTDFLGKICRRAPDNICS